MSLAARRLCIISAGAVDCAGVEQRGCVDVLRAEQGCKALGPGQDHRLLPRGNSVEAGGEALLKQVRSLGQAAGVALVRIAETVAGINERNLVIASASEEQAQVAREIDRNLVNIRDLSVQTSAGAQQTSIATQELSRLAVNLNGLVRRFKM